MILAGKQGAVLAGRMLLLHLSRDRRSVRFMGVGQLLWSGTNRYSTLTAIERNVGTIVDNDRAIHVDVCDVSGINVHHGSVVEERSAAPFAAIKSVATVTVSIVNAAVKPDLLSPVTAIPRVSAVIPAPIPRRP